MTIPSTVPQSDRPAPGTRPRRITFADAITHGLDYLGNDASTEPGLRSVRRAVVEAYRELVNCRVWTYLTTRGRINTNPAYSTGTISYDHTGGEYERLLTLTGGTWPAWSDQATELRIGSVLHRVDRRIDDTHLQLDATRNPGADVDHVTQAITAASHATPIVITSAAHGRATGDTVIVEGIVGNLAANGSWTITVVDVDTFSLDTSVGVADYVSGGTWRLPPTTAYSLLRDAYPLPEDFIAEDTPIAEGNFGGLEFAHPTAMLWADRLNITVGLPRFYTITSDDRYPGRLVTRFSPHCDSATSIDFIYHRRPRDLVLSGVSSGTATMTAGSNTVTGSGTAWTPGMVGAVLRLGSPGSEVPTGPAGTHPASFETIVTAWVSATEIRVSDPADMAYTSVKSEVSDPVDIEPGAMATAFLRGIEKNLVFGRRLSVELKPNVDKAFDMALREAKAADSRSFQGAAIGRRGANLLNVKYMPIRFT